MKLSHIPGHEPTEKVQYSWKTSSVETLKQYLEFYKQQTGVEVPMKDLTEQMLLDFMKEDKEFQKFLKTAGKPAADASPAPAPAPAAAAKAPAPAPTPAASPSAGTPGSSFGTGASSASSGQRND